MSADLGSAGSDNSGISGAKAAGRDAARHSAGQAAPKLKTVAHPSTDGISVRKCIASAKFFQCDDVSVSCLAAEVNASLPGDVVCFRSGIDDPVAFSADALARGAAAILTEQILPCPLPQAVVGDVTAAACRITATLEGDPSTRLLTIGVVGNAGKTSTSLLIAGLLRQAGIRTAYETDLGSSDGIVQTTDEAALSHGADLIRRLAEACDTGCGAAVVEYSGSSPGAPEGIGLDMIVVTGTAAAESDRHFGPDSLDLALDQAKGDAVVVVPADHPKLVRRVLDSGLRCISYGMRRSADLSAKVFDEQPGETTLMVSFGDETAVMETAHCGEAMVMNSLAAIAVGLLLESSLVESIEALRGLPAIPGRMQRLPGGDAASVVVDAARTPEQVADALRTLRRQRLGRGKLWCIVALDQMPSVESLSGDQRLAGIGRVVERFGDSFILTSTEGAKETFLHASHCVLDGFRNAALARLVADNRRAVQWAIHHAEPNDTIVIFTGKTGDTAVAQRKSLRSLEQTVEAARRDPQVKRYTPPATIPMFKTAAAKKG